MEFTKRFTVVPIADGGVNIGIERLAVADKIIGGEKLNDFLRHSQSVAYATLI